MVKSVTYRFGQLIATFALAVCGVYAYSILQVVYYREYFPTDAYPSTMCDSVYSCALYSLNLGLRNGGGIADSMDLMALDNPLFGWKLVFDLSYFMIINIVSMNIIFGIIIDTFAELRDAQNTRDDDYKNVCFICGYERDVFEKQGKSFDTHVTHPHNPTNYINFLIYLRDKPSDEYDGIESFVWDQYSEKKTHWVPIESTMLITVDKDEIDIDTKVDNLQEQIDGETANINEKLADIDALLDEIDLNGENGDGANSPGMINLKRFSSEKGLHKDMNQEKEGTRRVGTFGGN